MSRLPQADKSLGQHFLVNEGVIQQIGDAIVRFGTKRVVEIGPGPGPLTRELLKRGLEVAAVEIDPRMREHLREEFAAEIEAGRLHIVAGDACELPMSDILAGFRIPLGELVICGNLPYNVGTQIVFRFIEDCPEASGFCYMLQKEVVLRLIAEDASSSGRSDYGVPSVKLRWCTEVLGRFWVKPGSFAPPPKVDSGVFWMRRLTGEKLLADPLVRESLYDRAAQIVGQAFRQRRKMMRNSVPELNGTPWAEKRPEELRPADFLEVLKIRDSR